MDYINKMGKTIFETMTEKENNIYTKAYKAMEKAQNRHGTYDSAGWKNWKEIFGLANNFFETEAELVIFGNRDFSFSSSFMRGFIKDFNTNSPIKNVKIDFSKKNYNFWELNNMTQTLNRSIFSEDDGYFICPISNGNYTITITKQGYETKVIDDFIVTDSFSYDLEIIYLSKSNDFITDEEYGTLTDSGSCGTNAFWNFYEETGTLVIYGSGDMAFYEYQKVPWYQYRGKIKSVVIEEGINNISYAAFEDCTSLTNLTIPNSITIIDDNAFRDCSGLINVTIPNSVTTIGHYAFAGCTSLVSIVIPNSVTTIGIYAFFVCKNLTSVTISNSVTTIAYCTFFGCSSLSSITIPDSVTKIENSAFYNCYNLTDVYYSGTIEQWNNINKANYYNNSLNSAIIHYNS